MKLHFSLQLLDDSSMIIEERVGNVHAVMLCTLRMNPWRHASTFPFSLPIDQFDFVNRHTSSLSRVLPLAPRALHEWHWPSSILFLFIVIIKDVIILDATRRWIQRSEW